MDAYGMWEAIEPTVGTAVDPKKCKMAIAFLFQAILEDLVLQMASHTEAKQVHTVSGGGSGKEGSSSNFDERIRRTSDEGRRVS
jgi:hypothetical protein